MTADPPKSLRMNEHSGLPRARSVTVLRPPAPAQTIGARELIASAGEVECERTSSASGSPVSVYLQGTRQTLVGECTEVDAALAPIDEGG